MGMTIVTISDTHCNDLTKLNIPSGDLLIHAGDFTYRGTIAEVSKAMKELEEVSKNFKFGAVIVAGNHDWLFERDPAVARSLVPPGVVYLNDQETEVDGLAIWGSPVQPEFCNWAFNKRRGQEINEHWLKIPAGVDIVVTHGPPFGILDQTPMTRGHIGCSDLADHLIKRVKPRLHVFGHIHEGHGEQTVGGIKFVNAALLDDYYNIIYNPIIVEL